MKKRISRKRSANTKGSSARKRSSATAKSGTPKNVEEYLAGVPDASRSAFLELRAAIRSVVPSEAVEIISYGIPAFKDKHVLVWFAAFSNHCSLFPTAAVIEEFRDQLKGFSISKGTIHFQLDKPLPVALIKKLVKARITQSKEEATK